MSKRTTLSLRQNAYGLALSVEQPPAPSEKNQETKHDEDDPSEQQQMCEHNAFDGCVLRVESQLCTPNSKGRSVGAIVDLYSIYTLN
ncbi:MAG TPA: hypothetical protein VLV54_12325 [Thermoanaerobaculia bacterium]|nr:hypothetical protein [Thermoanaerobaculia bacterium]